MIFSSSHVWMWELDDKESWVPKNWCFWTVVLEKVLESPLDCKKIQPVHSKDQSWIFIGRTVGETPLLWPPDAKNWLIWKDPDARKDWRQEEKGMTEDEMVGRHHWQWTRVWVNSGIWRWTGRPGVLYSMSQRVRHDWATELNWKCLAHKCYYLWRGGSEICYFFLNESQGPGNQDITFLNPRTLVPQLYFFAI